MEVLPGQMTGLLGPNGAGKSTTIKMISTMLDPTSGDAFLQGYSIRKQPFEVRQLLGIIFQDPSLDHRLTGRENMEFHCMLYKVPRAERKERIRELATIVELEGVLDHPVKSYSGGMKRRLEIARGLLHRPRLLILDEPTVGLDPQTRTGMWNYIKYLRSQFGMAVLMTTHYMEEAEDCEQVYIMDQGRIIAYGTPLALIREIGENKVEIHTDNDEYTKEWLEKQGIPAIRSKKGLVFAPQHSLLPMQEFFTTIPTRLIRYNTAAFSLEDVFIRLTGKEIREETAGSHDQLRMLMKRKGRA
jgi:ABC-2 type transport system ATP-binding protein